jgi:hypothetical protein
MGWLHRRTGKALALALAAVWVATLAFANTAVTPAMHCQRGHMPCCPRSNSGETCSSARCMEQVPERSEAQAVQPNERDVQALVPPVRIEDAQRSATEPVWELTDGLHYHASVFRLKDDLRI